MKKHYICKRHNHNLEGVLDFYWDEEKGEISGDGAPYIMEAVEAGGTTAFPLWNWYKLGPEPLKSKRDMAAIIGFWYEVPEDLLPHYPRWKIDWSEIPEDEIF